MAATLHLLCVAVYLGGLVLAAGWDLATRSIPNRLALGIAVAANGAVLLTTPASLPSHALVALAVLLGGALLFFLKLWGAGDAKLLAAAALIVGAKGLSLLILATSIAGGILALIWLGARGMSKRRGGSSIQGLPYGVAIACGAVVAFFGLHAVGAFLRL